MTQLQEDVGFAQTLAANGRLLDILPYYKASPEWQEYQLDGCLQSSINLSGGDKLFFAPNTTDSYIGFFYNKELLKKAGYDSFPEDSWEDFWKMCDDLKAAGITPIAMDTLESAWCSMLTCTSVLGDDPEGIEFLTKLFPTDFENEHMVRVFETLKRIFENYTTGDAPGAPYAVAANNFCSEQVAIIANGPWMIESMYDPSYAAEGFAEKVGYATFPGHVMIVENDLIGSEGHLDGRVQGGAGGRHRVVQVQVLQGPDHQGIAGQGPLQPQGADRSQADRGAGQHLCGIRQRHLPREDLSAVLPDPLGRRDHV